MKKKYAHDVLPGSKQGLRLLLACRRLRELLSTTPTAETSVEVRLQLAGIVPLISVALFLKQGFDLAFARNLLVWACPWWLDFFAPTRLTRRK